MGANYRLSVLRSLLRSKGTLMSLGSDQYQDALGILFSWPESDPEGLRVACEYMHEVILRVNDLTKPGTHHRLSLEKALSIQDMVKDWKVQVRGILTVPDYRHRARACCKETVFSLGPAKVKVVKKGWRSVQEARREAGDTAINRGRYTMVIPGGVGGRWYVEYALPEDCTTEFGEVFDISQLEEE